MLSTQFEYGYFDQHEQTSNPTFSPQPTPLPTITPQPTISFQPTPIPTIAPVEFNEWVTSDGLVIPDLYIHNFNEMRIISVTMSGGYIVNKDLSTSICFQSQRDTGFLIFQDYIVFIVEEEGFTKYVKLTMRSIPNSLSLYLWGSAGSISKSLSSCDEVLKLINTTTSVPLATCTTCPGYGVNSIHFVTSFNAPSPQPTFKAPTFGPFQFEPFVSTIPAAIPGLHLKSLEEVSISADSMGGAMISLGLFKRPAVTPCLLITSPSPSSSLMRAQYIFYLEDFDALLKMVLVQSEVIDETLYLQGVEAGYRQKSKFESCQGLNNDWKIRTSVPLANCSTCAGLGIKDINIRFRPVSQPSSHPRNTGDVPSYETVTFWVYLIAWCIFINYLTKYCIRRCRRSNIPAYTTNEQDVTHIMPVAEVVNVGALATAVYEKVPSSDVEMVEMGMGENDVL